MLHKFTVQYYDAPAPLMSDDTARWMDDRVDELARQVGAQLAGSSMQNDGSRIVRLSNGRRVWRVRLVARGNRFYTVVTSHPIPGSEADRFFDSFALLQ
jgi:hypothetical protein